MVKVTEVIRRNESQADADSEARLHDNEGWLGYRVCPLVTRD